MQKPKCQGSFNGIKLRNNIRAAPCLKETPVVSGSNRDNILDNAAWHEKLAAIGWGMALNEIKKFYIRMTGYFLSLKIHFSGTPF